MKPTNRVLIALAVLTALSGLAGAQPLDVATLLVEARAMAENEDFEAWGEHAFKRHVTRQQFDEEGDIEWKQEMVFQVTPSPTGFDEQLLEIDGREPTEKEFNKHRKAGRFENHYRDAESLILENPFGKDLPLLPLVLEQEHEYVGEDEFDGIPCSMVHFSPRPEPDAPMPDKLRYAMQGDLCFSKADSRLIQVDVETTREVSKSLVGVKELRIQFELRPQGDAWLPARFEMRSDVKALGSPLRRHNIYRYTDYQRP
jgi:hypothetical protein